MCGLSSNCRELRFCWDYFCFFYRDKPSAIAPVPSEGTQRCVCGAWRQRKITSKWGQLTRREAWMEPGRAWKYEGLPSRTQLGAGRRGPFNPALLLSPPGDQAKLCPDSCGHCHHLSDLLQRPASPTTMDPYRVWSAHRPLAAGHSRRALPDPALSLAPVPPPVTCVALPSRCRRLPSQLPTFFFK